MLIPLLRGKLLKPCCLLQVLTLTRGGINTFTICEHAQRNVEERPWGVRQRNALSNSQYIQTETVSQSSARVAPSMLPRTYLIVLSLLHVHLAKGTSRNVVKKPVKPLS